MDLKNLFNSYVLHGLNIKLNGLDGQEEWNKKISSQDSSLNVIPGGWVTTRIFYNGTTSSNKDEIYDYLYNRIGMKGEKSDSSLNNFEQFHFLLQTARLVKNNPSCTIERLAQIGYNVGQLLASIDFYSEHPLSLQYISTNKLNLVSSYVSGSNTSVQLLPPEPSAATTPEPSAATTPATTTTTPVTTPPATTTTTPATTTTTPATKPLSGGTGLPVIDMYKKYIDMTPYKGYKMVGGGCTCGKPGCDKCDCQIINLLI
jgi:hypothetical protein